MKKTFIVTIVMLGTIGLLFLLANFSEKTEEKKMTRYEEMSSREVALLCTTDMATTFHIHPTIHVFVDGEEVLIPKNLGITDTCMYSIHAHEDTPIVHVEAPVQKDFTLGDFFAVWEMPFDSSTLLEHTLATGDKLEVTIDGTVVNTFEQTPLRDGEKIVISLTTK